MKTTDSIAYQGEPGANSHIACAENFPDLNPLPCATFEDAFAAVQDGAAELVRVEPALQRPCLLGHLELVDAGLV